MSVLFFAFLFFAWVGFGVISAVYDQTTVGTSAWSVVASLDIWRESQVSLLWLDFTFPVPNGQWFSSLFGLLLWESSLWSDWGNMVRIPIFVAMTVGVVGSFIISLFGNRLSKG
jgi:hypothetical protein